MAVSFKEKRELQKEIETCFASLDANPDFKTKRALQKQIEVAFAKLEGSAEPQKQTLYERLVAGEFINERPIAFCDILKDALKEVGNNLKMIVEPVISYLVARQQEIGVFESASTTVSEALHHPDRVKFLLNEIRGLYGDEVILKALR